MVDGHLNPGRLLVCVRGQQCLSLLIVCLLCRRPTSSRISSKTMSGFERPLGVMEWLVSLMDQALPMNCVVAVNLRSPIAESSLRTALDALQSRHPLLQVGIIADGARAAFVSENVPQIPLRVGDVVGTDCLTEIERELGERFPVERGPLLRCTLLRSTEKESSLLLTFHHAIGDGVSAIRMIRDILGAAIEPSSLPPPRPLPRAMDELMPPWMRGWKGFWQYVKMTLADQMTTPRTTTLHRFPVDNSFPLHQRRVRLIFRQFAPAIVQELVARARQEQTTLYGALAAAQLIATAGEFPHDARVGISSAVNARPTLVPALSEDDVGMYVSMSYTTHVVARHEGFWDLARELSDIQESRLVNHDPRLLGVDRLWAGSILRRLMAARLIGVDQVFALEQRTVIKHSAISVFPKIRSLEGDAIGVESAQAAFSQPHIPWFTIAWRVGNNLTWSFMYHEPSIKSDHAECLARHSQEILELAVA